MTKLYRATIVAYIPAESHSDAVCISKDLADVLTCDARTLHARCFRDEVRLAVKPPAEKSIVKKTWYQKLLKL